ncbi:MAG: DNA polymerase II [Spirochaetales bacterium]|uniref:DNA polymerase n=1 Tax=Candidatus Thalassospirochaeta sargassi TaxID=3119039 RepID=A0AAJ1MJ37_9SPIO|nr:DNA polymerase II [Spirochaetales bacterium]
MKETPGFILTAHCLDINGRCELHYYCCAPDGPCKIIVSPHKPVFFINRETPASLTSGIERRPLDMVGFAGSSVDALYFNSLNRYFDTRRNLREGGVKTYESDVRAEDRFLMERFISGGVRIQGEPRNENGLKVFRNPAISPYDYRPALSMLSIDIETGTDGSMYSAAFHFTPAAEHSRQGEQKLVLMRGSPGADAQETPAWLSYCPDERSLLTDFIRRVKVFDADLLIGWHVIGFDLSFIQGRAEVLNIPVNIGRGRRRMRLNEKRNGMFAAEIEGRIVIDGPQTLRTAFYKFDNYRLETVASQLLGRGKDIRPDLDKVAEIERRFTEDKEALARYNLEDSVLVTEIFQHTAIIDQLITRSLITGLPVDKVHMSVAAFDHFMLPRFHRRGIVAPETIDITAGEHAAGGHVFTSPAGLYPHVVVLDFKSLYPTIMRTFFIDPYSRMKSDIDTVLTPEGISFSRTENILPEFLAELMSKRARARADDDSQLAQAVKILLNSFYGVMGTTGCRFYHPDLPTAITGTGQWILKNSAAFLREKGYSVIYGDTDSVFVCLKEKEQQKAAAAGNKLAEMVNEYLAGRLKNEFGVESKLEIEFEKHYVKFFLPPMRYTTDGARKKYAGLLENGEIEFKGLETVRSDWTELARNFQQELFRRFFSGEDLKLWIRNFIEELKNGQYNESLVYRRRLKRAAEAYTKTSPPHVKAARRLDPDGSKKISEVSYIITAEGPEPVELAEAPPDYRHYIEKQIRPIADGVLFAVGDDFDSIIDGRQLNLFEG